MAGEIDPVRIVDDAIEDGVGVGGIADQLVPFVDGDLAGDDGRPAAVASERASVVSASMSSTCGPGHKALRLESSDDGGAGSHALPIASHGTIG